MTPKPPAFIVAFLCAVSSLNAAISVTGSTVGWNAVLYDDTDQNNTRGAADNVVGDANHPSFYTRFSDGEMGFRIRVAGGKNSGFDESAWVGVDLNYDGKIDLFVGAMGSSREVGIYHTGAGENISPSTTSVDTSKPYTTSNFATSFSFDAVSKSTDPMATDYNIEGANGKKATNYFVSFKVSFSELEKAVTSLGLPGVSLTKESPLRYLVAMGDDKRNSASPLVSLAPKTNGQNNNTGTTTTTPETWEESGALTSSYSSTGVVQVPEPSSAALLCLPLLLCWKRKRG